DADGTGEAAGEVQVFGEVIGKPASTAAELGASGFEIAGKVAGQVAGATDGAAEVAIEGDRETAVRGDCEVEGDTEDVDNDRGERDGSTVERQAADNRDRRVGVTRSVRLSCECPSERFELGGVISVVESRFVVAVLGGEAFEDLADAPHGDRKVDASGTSTD